jgi:hypothetical protein
MSPARKQSKSRFARQVVTGKTGSSRSQARAAAELEAFFESRINPLSGKEIDARTVGQWKGLFTEYDRLVTRAYRVGLHDHPYVRARIGALQTIGDRKTLRRSRGAEAGVPGALSPRDLTLADEIQRAREAGHSWEEIRQDFKRTGLYTANSATAFQKLRDRVLEAKLVRFPQAGAPSKELIQHIKALRASRARNR